MSHLYEIKLPFPPSINDYYENRQGTVRGGKKAGKVYIGRMISPAGRLFRDEVFAAVRKGHRVAPFLTGRLAICILVRPPAEKVDGTRNSNRRDMDNILKALQDALTKAGVIADDSLFDDVRVFRWMPAHPGYVRVRISRFEPDQAQAFARELGEDPGDLFG